MSITVKTRQTSLLSVCLARAVLVLVLLAFVAELLGLAHHAHTYGVSDGCASCEFIHSLPQQPSLPALDVLPVAMHVVWLVAPIRIYRFLPARSYLIPLAQAPPALSLS